MQITTLALLFASVAHAGTVDLSQQLRLTDSIGTPINGDQRVEFQLVGD